MMTARWCAGVLFYGGLIVAGYVIADDTSGLRWPGIAIVCMVYGFGCGASVGAWVGRGGQS